MDWGLVLFTMTAVAGFLFFGALLATIADKEGIK